MAVALHDNHNNMKTTEKHANIEYTPTATSLITEHCSTDDLPVNKNAIWLKLVECVESCGRVGWDGLTSKKIRDRGATLTEIPDRPGKFLVEIERHRAIAGATYSVGQPMSAYKTYIQQLVFDPVAGTLGKLEDKQVSDTVNVYELARETFAQDYCPVVYRKLNWKRKRRVILGNNCGEFDTYSLEDACDKIEQEFRAMYHDAQFEDLDMDEKTKQRHVSEFEDEFVALALEGLREAWSNPELLEDE